MSELLPSDLLIVADLRAGYGEAIVLDDVRFSLAAGQSLELFFFFFDW